MRYQDAVHGEFTLPVQCARLIGKLYYLDLKLAIVLEPTNHTIKNDLTVLKRLISGPNELHCLNTTPQSTKGVRRKMEIVEVER
jgi:hypothetical protein